MAMGVSEDFQQPLPHVPVQTPPLDFNSIPPEGHATYQDSHDQQVHVYNDAEVLVNSATTLTNNAKDKGKMPMSYSEEACAQVDAESFWKNFQPAGVLQPITNDKTKTLRLFGIDIQEGAIGVTDESPSERF